MRQALSLHIETMTSKELSPFTKLFQILCQPPRIHATLPLISFIFFMQNDDIIVLNSIPVIYFFYFLLLFSMMQFCRCWDFLLFYILSLSILLTSQTNFLVLFPITQFFSPVIYTIEGSVKTEREREGDAYSIDLLPRCAQRRQDFLDLPHRYRGPTACAVFCCLYRHVSRDLSGLEAQQPKFG